MYVAAQLGSTLLITGGRPVLELLDPRAYIYHRLCKQKLNLCQYTWVNTQRSKPRRKVQICHPHLLPVERFVFSAHFSISIRF